MSAFSQALSTCMTPLSWWEMAWNGCFPVNETHGIAHYSPQCEDIRAHIQHDRCGDLALRTTEVAIGALVLVPTAMVAGRRVFHSRTFCESLSNLLIAEAVAVMAGGLIYHGLCSI